MNSVRFRLGQQSTRLQPAAVLISDINLYTMNLLVLCVVLFVVGGGAAQWRSSYVSRPVGYPDVASRFNTNDGDGLSNRFGDGQSPRETPPGTLGDPYVVDRVRNLPREKLPYWYLNQQQILRHIGATQGNAVQ